MIIHAAAALFLFLMAWLIVWFVYKTVKEVWPWR